MAIMLPFAAEEMLRINHFSVSTIFFTNINMSFQKQAPEMFCKKRCSQKFHKIHRKTGTGVSQNTSGTLLFSFANLYSDLFSSIAKKFNQIRNKVVCVVASLLLCFAGHSLRWNAFQHIFINQKKSEFYGPYFQTMIFLVTMFNNIISFSSFLLQLHHETTKA